MNEAEFKKFENFLRVVKEIELEEFFLTKFEELTFSFICPENEAFVWTDLDLLEKRENDDWGCLDFLEKRSAIVVAMTNCEQLKPYLFEVKYFTLLGFSLISLFSENPISQRVGQNFYEFFHLSYTNL